MENSELIAVRRKANISIAAVDISAEIQQKELRGEKVIGDVWETNGKLRSKLPCKVRLFLKKLAIDILTQKLYNFSLLLKNQLVSIYIN